MERLRATSRSKVVVAAEGYNGSPPPLGTWSSRTAAGLSVALVVAAGGCGAGGSPTEQSHPGDAAAPGGSIEGSVRHRAAIGHERSVQRKTRHSNVRQSQKTPRRIRGRAADPSKLSARWRPHRPKRVHTPAQWRESARPRTKHKPKARRWHHSSPSADSGSHEPGTATAPWGTPASTATGP